MSFLDYYNTEVEPLEERLGTGEHLAKSVDDLRQWLIKDKDKENVGVQRKIHDLGGASGKAGRSGADGRDGESGVDGQDGTQGRDGEDGADGKDAGPRLSEFGGKGNRGWWYLFADPRTIDTLSEVLDGDEFQEHIAKKVKLGRNKFLTGYRYIMNPMEGADKPNKYRSVYLVKDKINPKEEDRSPDFGFIIFDGKESFDHANKLFLKGMIDDLYGDPKTASQLLKFSQPRPTDVADNPIFYNSFRKIPTENLPDEHVKAIEDLLKELKAEIEIGKAGEEYPTENIKFTSFYQVDEDFEIIQEASGYLINDLLASVGSKVFKGLGLGLKSMMMNRKPKPLKIKRIEKHMIPNKTFNISYQGYVATNTGCAQSMMEYKNYVAQKGMMWAKAAGMQSTFITQRFDPDFQTDQEAFVTKFGLKPAIDITEMTLWKTSNGGWVTTMSLREGLDAPDETEVRDGEEEYTGPEKINQDERDDLQFYVGCDVRGEKYFIDTFGMGIKQYLQNVKSASGATLKKQGEAIHSSFTQIKDVGSNFVEKKTQAKKYNEIKKNFEAWAKENLEQMVRQKTQPIDDKNEKGVKYVLKDGGEVSFFRERNPEQRQFANHIRLTPKAFDLFKQQQFDPDGMNDYKKAGEE